MFRTGPQVIGYILNKTCGLSGIIVLGLLASAAMGCVIGRIGVAKVLLTEMATSANSLNASVLGVDGSTRWPGR